MIGTIPDDDRRGTARGRSGRTAREPGGALAETKPDAAEGWRGPVRRVLGDWRKFNPKIGVVAVVGVLLVLVAVRDHGLIALVAALAFVQGVMVAAPLQAPSRVRALVVFALLGGVVTALGLWVGHQHAPTTVVLVAVAFAAGLTTAVGPVTSRVSTSVGILFLTMVFYARRTQDLPRVTLAFVCGVAAVAALVWLLPRLRGAGSALPSGDEAVPHGRPAWQDAVRERGALRFATVLAASAGLALTLGWLWFPDHPHWAAATLLLLLRPSPGHSLQASLQRMAGTLVGGALMVWAVGGVRDPRWLLAVLVAAAFLTAATAGVGQTAFSVFFTLLLLTIIALNGGDSSGTAIERVAEVALGAVVAVVATAFLQVLPDLPGTLPDPETVPLG